MGTIILENCRLCYSRPGFYELKSNKQLIKQILEFLRIKVNDKSMNLLPASICEDCNKFLKDFSEFKQQIKSVDDSLRKTLKDSTEIEYICGNYHEEEVEEQETFTYKCHICPATFHTEFTLQEHIVSHDIPPKFQCKSCKKIYRSEQTFQKHSCARKYFCLLCLTDLKNMEDYKNHVCQVASEEAPETNEKECNEEELVLETDISTQVLYVQEEIIHEIPSVKCSLCDEDFETSYALKLHKARSHKTKYHCSWPDCTKCFQSKSSLKNHLNYHQGNRSYLCVNCGKSFITKNSLDCHEKTHLEVKGYSCKLCNKSFSIRSNLRSHEKKVHEGIRYYCPQCGLSYLTKGSLERHEKIHTGIKEFPCELCSKAFYTRKELAKHIRYHQGVRLYKCEHCFKSFFESHHLTIHSRIHTGERPYACTVPNCGKAFRDSQKLKRHQNSKH